MRLALPPGADVAAMVAGVAGTTGESVVVVVMPGREPLAQALVLAAIGPLAVEHAPATRINAVIVAEGAVEAHVDAAVRFLEGAGSTTGQVLTVY